MAGDGGSAAGSIMGVAGLGMNYAGGIQQSHKIRAAQQRLEQAVGRYNTRQTGFNDQLQGQLDTLGGERRAQLEELMRGQVSPNRAQAGANASALAGTQMNAALSQNRQALPWRGNMWTNQNSGAVGALQGRQQGRTNTQIGNALAYGQASRGAQGLETYDRQGLNAYGNQLTSIDRRSQEAQQSNALHQAKLDQIWNTLGVRYGAGVNRAQNGTSGLSTLGTAMALGGTYLNSNSANQPAIGGAEPYFGQGLEHDSGAYTRMNDMRSPYGEMLL